MGFMDKFIVKEEEKPSLTKSEIQETLSEFSKSSSEGDSQNVDVTGDFSVLNSIEEIYQENNLADSSKSIFKVDEFIKALPNTLSAEVKKQSIGGILIASGITLDQVKEDAINRKNVLNSVLANFSEETKGMSDEINAKIAEFEGQIDKLKDLAIERSKLQETQEKIINDEIAVIEKIETFIK